MKTSTGDISNLANISMGSALHEAQKSEMKYGVEDWRKLNGLSEAVLEGRPEEINTFFNSFWPATEHYISPLNPAFILDLPALTKYEANECWLIRDGLVPLLWFFTNNPAPGRFKGKLRIHRQFESFVPESWRPQVELYELFPGGYGQVQSQPGNEPTELVLTGIVAPSICSLGQLETELREIVQAVGGQERLAKMDIKCYLPIRFESFDFSNGPAFSNVFLQTLFKVIGLNVTFVDYEGFRWSAPGTRILFHEFNENLIYAESYLSLLSMMKGHLPVLRSRALVENETKNFNEVIPIFPHVSCGINKDFSKKTVDYTSKSWVQHSEERAKALYYATNSAANKAYPWPKWFPFWCKEVQSIS